MKFLQVFNHKKNNELYIWGLMLTLLFIIIEEFFMPRSGLHSGALFPRYLFLKPISNSFLYLLEWLVQIICILFILKRKFTRVALLVLTSVFIFGTLQVFSNHKFLVALNLLALCLSTNIYNDPSHDKQQRNIFNFIRIQLVIVYFFSITSKLEDSFYTGDSLATLMQLIGNSSFSPLVDKSFHLWLSQSSSLTIAISWITLILEAIIPFALSRFYHLGLILQVILHLSFSLFMPGVFTFGMMMISMGFLFKKN